MVASLLKQWLDGTRQGAVSQKHLPYYLDEFTFRFNLRGSKSRGKLFFRLVQQAAATGSQICRDVAHFVFNDPRSCGTFTWGVKSS